MKRNILHLRVDSFPVAVERLKYPSLKNKPVVICARHTPRSLIYSASPEARQEGVYEGLPLTKALKRCRRLTVRSPNERLYQRAGEQIARLLGAYSPLIEPDRWGQFYVDMSGTGRLLGALQDSAYQIRREVRDGLRLISTLGIGSNKLVSGVAARLIQSHGDLYTVPPGSEASFLAPLRVQMLPAIHNRKDRTLLQELNIRQIQQLAKLSMLQLAVVFRKRAPLLHKQALGIDYRPVLPPAAKSFVLEEETLDDDTNDDGILLGRLYRLMELACQRMRAQNVIPRTGWLHLRHSNGIDITRRLRLKAPTNIDLLLFSELEPLYMNAAARRQRIRYMSLTFTDLVQPDAQLTLFETPVHPREEKLALAMDAIRTRFGDKIAWGRTLCA